jgi:hypothetical protein
MSDGGGQPRQWQAVAAVPVASPHGRTGIGLTGGMGIEATTASLTVTVSDDREP